MPDKEYENNLKRIKEYAYVTGLVLNPDEERVKNVVERMTENFKVIGQYVCPCKQKNKPPVKGRDIVCPCSDLMVEILKNGYCHCCLFYTPESAGKFKRGLVQIERG